MFRLLVKILGMPKNGQGSGKREVAALFAIFTMGLIIWAWPSMADAAKVTTLSWLISASVVMLAAAFGMESLINQAGFRFSGGDSKEASGKKSDEEELG